MRDYREVQKIADKLDVYSDYEMNELSEACQLLSKLSGYPDYLSDEFYHELTVEMLRQLNNYQENAEIVKTTETFTREVVELVWKYD